MKLPCVYILASKQFGTIYVGVTSNLHRRMAEHSQELLEGFTKKYGVKRLVYLELHQTLPDAIHRERQLTRRGGASGKCASSNNQIPNGTICSMKRPARSAVDLPMRIGCREPIDVWLDPDLRQGDGTV